MPWSGPGARPGGFLCRTCLKEAFSEVSLFSPTLTNSHACVQDLAKDSAPHYKAARKLFDALALQMSGQAHALDVFACSLDQASVWASMRAWQLLPGISLLACMSWHVKL